MMFSLLWLVIEIILVFVFRHSVEKFVCSTAQEGPDFEFFR